MPFAANVVELSFIGATQFHAIKPRSSFSHNVIDRNGRALKKENTTFCCIQIKIPLLPYFQSLDLYTSINYN